MALIEDVGLDRGALEAARKFLLSRLSDEPDPAGAAPATAAAPGPGEFLHARQVPALRAAEAACMLRDAGVIALLLGDGDDARSSLARAGDRFVGLGLFVGYFLRTIASAESSARESSEMQLLLRSPGAAVRALSQRPFLRDSLASARQWLHLYQAMQARGLLANDFRAERLFARRLGEMPVAGETGEGMPARAYVRLAVALAGHDDPAPTGAADDAQALLLHRAVAHGRRLRSLREDRYHWELLADPVALLDPDLLFLFLQVAPTIRAQVGAGMRTLDAESQLAWQAAETLRSEPEPEMTPRRSLRGGGALGAG